MLRSFLLALPFELPLTLTLDIFLACELLAPALNYPAALRFDLLKVERRRRSISLCFRRLNVPIEDQRILRERSVLTFELA